MDGSVDAADQTLASDRRQFDFDASVTCVTTVPRAIPLQPELLILLDRSASMNDAVDDDGADAGAATSKWAQLTAALERLGPATDAATAWGLMFVGGGEGPSACAVPNTPALAPVLHAAAAISDAIAHAQPAGSTPLATAIEVAATYLAGRDNGAPRYLVLATDGQATCGSSTCASASSEAPGTCDDDAALAAVAAARARGIATYVVGVAAPGSGADRVLGGMASAGGYPRMAEPMYYPVASDGVDAALAPIAAATSCSFEISPPLPPDGRFSGVTVDGVSLPSPEYKLVGNGRLELTGQACADYLAGKITNVAAQVACPA